MNEALHTYVTSALCGSVIQLEHKYASVVMLEFVDYQNRDGGFCDGSAFHKVVQ